MLIARAPQPLIGIQLGHIRPINEQTDPSKNSSGMRIVLELFITLAAKNQDVLEAKGQILGQPVKGFELIERLAPADCDGGVLRKVHLLEGRDHVDLAFRIGIARFRGNAARAALGTAHRPQTKPRPGPEAIDDIIDNEKDFHAFYLIERAMRVATVDFLRSALSVSLWDLSSPLISPLAPMKPIFVAYSTEALSLNTR